MEGLRVRNPMPRWDFEEWIAPDVSGEVPRLFEAHVFEPGENPDSEGRWLLTGDPAEFMAFTCGFELCDGGEVVSLMQSCDGREVAVATTWATFGRPVAEAHP